MKLYIGWLKIKCVLIMLLFLWLILFGDYVPGYINRRSCIGTCLFWVIVVISKLILFIHKRKIGYILNVITSILVCVYVASWSILGFVFALYEPYLVVVVVAVTGCAVAYNIWINRCLRKCL